MRRSSTGRSVSSLGRRRLLAPPNRLAQLNRRRRWVLQLWDAFLVHMDDFDRLLEFQLRRTFDPVVAAPVPVRRGRAGSGSAQKPRDGRLSKEHRREQFGDVLILPS